MKNWIVGLTAVVGSFIVTPAQAVEVCGYTVSSVFGVNCPVRVGQTACFSIETAIGPCDAPIECFGGPGFFCRAKMIPTSGPRAQCPASSVRPKGFNCFAPRLFVPTRTPTPPPVDTDTPTFTATGTPEEPTATATSEEDDTPTATEAVATPTDTPVVVPTSTDTPLPELTATATGTPTGTAEATATVTGTPTGTAAASLVLRF
jgi:hypothetical protein